MKTKCIDQYICIDKDQIVIDEMNEIIDTDTNSFNLKEDIKQWKQLQKAAKVVLGFYKI